MDEEVVMMMMESPESVRNETTCEEPMTSTTDCRSWKLYDNPCYCSQVLLSSPKVAPFFFDLSSVKPIIASELDLARTQIAELKSELEDERRKRKRAEDLNKKLAGELEEEKRRTEETERLCSELAGEISSGKAEIEKRRKEMEDERKKMRVAEVLREERVQMKLTEARILLEEKILKSPAPAPAPATMARKNSAPARLVLGEKCWSNHNIGTVSTSGSLRRASPEPENPHIRRGIKGFVEFPKVVRAVGAKSRHWGSKLECQKAQLRILLKQKSSIGSSNSLIIS